MSATSGGAVRRGSGEADRVCADKPHAYPGLLRRVEGAHLPAVIHDGLAQSGAWEPVTPRSFALDATPPTVTVEAACSKHRRKDVLPLHPELVGELRKWFVGMKPTQKLFPILERKKTWFMVRKDLERVGIPYETEDGIADFHAAGRHTHITELLRNGTSLAGGQGTGPTQRCQHDDEVHPYRHPRPGESSRQPARAEGAAGRTRVPRQFQRAANALHFLQRWESSGDIPWQRRDGPETPKPLAGQGF